MTIFITPPEQNNDTDKDSTGEEEANNGIVHFPRNMLEAVAEIVVNEADNNALNKKQKHKKKKQYKWRKGDIEKTQQFTTFSDYEVPENDNLNLHKQWTPAEAAELFLFSNDILEMIKTCTIKYTNKRLNFTFDVTIDELKVFFSIILLSGYVNVVAEECIGIQQLILTMKPCQMQ